MSDNDLTADATSTAPAAFAERHLALLAIEHAEETERAAQGAAAANAQRRPTLAVFASDLTHGGRRQLDIRPKAPVSVLSCRDAWLVLCGVLRRLDSDSDSNRRAASTPFCSSSALINWLIFFFLRLHVCARVCVFFVNLFFCVASFARWSSECWRTCACLARRHGTRRRHCGSRRRRSILCACR